MWKSVFPARMKSHLPPSLLPHRLKSQLKCLPKNRWFRHRRATLSHLSHQRPRWVETIREKPGEKPLDKPVDKPLEKVTKAEKPVEKIAEKLVPKDSDAKRAAAILAGQSDVPVAKSGEYLVLIGAFSNEANVKNLKAKLSEQGIKTFSEPLDTPQGKKTRVRAGPFASREAADKALEKMQKIGVTGVVSAK
jgi:DedD protein